MSLHRENKKALVEALLALMLNAQHSTPTEGEEETNLGNGEDEPMNLELIPLGEPLTVTISNGNNVSTTVLKLEEVEGDVCGTIVGNMTDIDEDELTVSDNLLIMFTDLERKEMLNI
jgi:hypothetical protein